MKRVAIIGAGLSGLATAIHLQDLGASVKLFDAGGGASRAATGLLHPYPGKEGRLSWKGYEALESAKRLIERFGGEKIASFNGILKNGELIEEGITVQMHAYLETLRNQVDIEERTIHSLEELSEYDDVIIAAGAQIEKFVDANVRYVKGQSLRARGDFTLERSVIGGGHISPTKTPGEFLLGSTYERGFASDEPDQEVAEGELIPKISAFEMRAAHLSAISCAAGVRVSRKEHYFPIVRKVSNGVWVIGALGSRGLLYHSLLGDELARAVWHDDETLISEEVRR